MQAILNMRRYESLSDFLMVSKFFEMAASSDHPDLIEKRKRNVKTFECIGIVLEAITELLAGDGQHSYEDILIDAVKSIEERIYSMCKEGNKNSVCPAESL